MAGEGRPPTSLLAWKDVDGRADPRDKPGDGHDT
jgi:hypothetical protein